MVFPAVLLIADNHNEHNKHYEVLQSFSHILHKAATLHPNERRIRDSLAETKDSEYCVNISQTFLFYCLSDKIRGRTLARMLLKHYVKSGYISKFRKIFAIQIVSPVRFTIPSSNDDRIYCLSSPTAGSLSGCLNQQPKSRHFDPLILS
jgi:hypothetical protein